MYSIQRSTISLRVLLAILVMLGLVSAQPSSAQTADSVADFSSTQGSGNWFYGFYDQGPQGGLPHGYTAGAFVEMDVFSDGSQRWQASELLVSANNNFFLNVNSEGGHPTGLEPDRQDSIIWAVRRYVVPTAGLARIEFDLRKRNVINPDGGGVTGRRGKLQLIHEAKPAPPARYTGGALNSQRTVRGYI